MRAYSFIVFVVFLSAFIADPKKDVYPKSYKVAKVPGIEKFRVFTKTETRLDSLYDSFDRRYDTIAELARPKNDFRNNRVRFTSRNYINGKRLKPRKTAEGFMPMGCNCILRNDSIIMGTGMGMMGGFGIDLVIHKSEFSTFYYTYTDDDEPFKSALTDTAFRRYARVSSKEQELVLEQQPAFRQGEQLTGYLTFTSKPYYYRSDSKLNTASIKARMHFTCKLKSEGKN